MTVPETLIAFAHRLALMRSERAKLVAKSSPFALAWAAISLAPISAAR